MRQNVFFPPSTRAHVIHGSYKPEGLISPRSSPVTPGILTLGFFGRLSPEKGVTQLIESLKGLPPGSWKLRIGGSGDTEYVEEVTRVANDLPVEILGMMKPTDFYSSVDAVIVSSLWNDPAPRVVYEAGMHGVIPIVSQRGGLPQLVGYGSRGLVFDPSIEGSLIKQIESLVLHPKLSEDYRKLWLEVFDSFLPETVAAQTVSIFERAIESYSPRQAR